MSAMRPARDDGVLAVVLGVLVAGASAVYGSSVAGAVFGAGPYRHARPVYARADPSDRSQSATSRS